jgi:hypothetical protein
MNIVQQYMYDFESKLTLVSKSNKQPPTVSIKRGSAKHLITFIADDFNAPLELIEKKPFNPKQFFGVSHLKNIDQQLEEMRNEWKR